jgi:SAM-dependent methyltransferase
MQKTARSFGKRRSAQHLRRESTRVMDRKTHWDGVYTTKASDEVSWFQSEPTVSLRLLERSGLTAETCVIDIGGGDSRLVDHLVTRGLRCVTVLDVSAAALARARARLGPQADRVHWIEADVTGPWTVSQMNIWHDRAAFHFLTEADDRARYVAHVRDVVTGGGTVIIGTFAPDGPERCSGLPVRRYDPAGIGAELGEGFTLVDTLADVHRTPAGAVQSFTYSRFVRDP